MLKYALDIGSHNIRLVAGFLKSGSIEIKGCLSSETEGYFGGTVVDNRKLLFSVLKVTREFMRKYGIRPKSVLLNCSNQFMRLHHLKGKFQRRDPDIPIRKRELEKFKQDLLRDRIGLEEKELFVDVDGYKIDEQKGIVNPEGMLAKCVEISLKVITMPVSIYNNFLSVIGEAGIEVEALIPEILAKAWVLTSGEERRAGIMVVDLGWGCLKVITFKDDKIYSLGSYESKMKDTFELLGSIHHLKGDHLDTIFDQSLITEGKEISLQVGGSLKTIPVASVRGVLTRRIKKMFYLLRRHIDEEGVGHLLGEGILITGGKVLEYPGLVELGEEVLHQPLRIRKFELAGLGNEYATAYGLLKLIHDSEYRHTGARKLVSNLWGRFLAFFDKYF